MDAVTAEAPAAAGRAAKRTTPHIQQITSWDGLKLAVRIWDGGSRRRPLLLLPGLARTGEDFAGLAEALGAGRLVVAPDYAGHGRSDRARKAARYGPEACVRDVLDICAALHVHDAIGIGTSFGGLLCMGIAAVRPALLRAVVLNDIGPEIAPHGADFVRRFVGTDPALPDVAACIAYLRNLLPALSLHTEAEWEAMARLTYGRGEDGHWHPLWDTRLARLVQPRTPSLWPLFGGLAHLPLLLVRGAASDILLEETVRRMQAFRSDMAVVCVPRVGHAPTLLEDEALSALRLFLERAG